MSIEDGRDERAAADFRFVDEAATEAAALAPEQQPPVEGETVQPEGGQSDEEEKLPPGILGWIRKFERSNFGFALKLSAALTLSRMAPEHAIPRIAQYQVEQADERRWEGAHARHPELAKPGVELLSEAAPEQQAEILQQRDVQYEDAINDAVKAYFEAIGPGEGTTVDMKAIQETLRQHRPSQVDRTLLELGVPVGVDRPYPVVRFVPNASGESTRALKHKLDKRSAEGLFDPAGGGDDQADTIFVELKKYDPATAFRTYRHEEMHWRLSSFEKKRGTSQILEHALGQERVFSEGLTELLNKEVDIAEGREAPIHAYDPYIWAVDKARSAIGKDRFWDLVKTDWTDGVRKELDHRYGIGASLSLFSPGRGAQDVFSENPETAYREFRDLSNRGLMQRGDVASASERLSLNLPQIERTFMVSPTGKPIGYVLPSPEGIDLRVDLPGVQGHFGETAAPDRRLQPMSRFPGVEKLWQNFKPTAEAAFARQASQADSDDSLNVEAAEQTIHQFETFRDSVAVELEDQGS